MISHDDVAYLVPQIENQIEYGAMWRRKSCGRASLRLELG